VPNLPTPTAPATLGETTCLPCAWIGDLVNGRLQTYSHNLLHDRKRDAYYDASHGAEDSDSGFMRADLYALARVGCELGLPPSDRQELLAECDQATRDLAK
jgi:hypothetical protein